MPLINCWFNEEYTLKAMCCSQQLQKHCAVWCIPHCMPAYSLIIPSFPIFLLCNRGKKNFRSGRGQCVLTVMAIMWVRDTAKVVNAGFGHIFFSVASSNGCWTRKLVNKENLKMVKSIYAWIGITSKCWIKELRQLGS